MLSGVCGRVRSSRGLGFVARHLYLQRVRNDGNYDVRAFCRSTELENEHGSDVTCCVRKEETFRPPIRHVTVDGEPYAYDVANGDVALTVMICSPNLGPFGMRVFVVRFRVRKGDQDETEEVYRTADYFCFAAG